MTSTSKFVVNTVGTRPRLRHESTDATEALDRLLARFEVHQIDRSTAVAASKIIATLRDRDIPLNDLHDGYIAATARTEQLPVLTANVSHFKRIDDVQVVDWEEF